MRKSKNPQQKNARYVFGSIKSLWCLRPESNRYARFHEAADFKCPAHSMHGLGTRMDIGLLAVYTARQKRVLRPVGQKIPSSVTGLMMEKS